MHPPDCPAWEYNTLPSYRDRLAAQITAILTEIVAGSFDTRAFATDTRPSHERLFRELVPREHSYFAGHYRGENFRCLRYLMVWVATDRRVGSAPNAVGYLMAERVAPRITQGVAGNDAAQRLPDAQVGKLAKVLNAVRFACSVFELFLTIHPYANGNGHVARLVLWAILGRYGYWPRSFTIEPRPPDPPYSQLITAYRDGNFEPLENFVLACLAN